VKNHLYFLCFIFLTWVSLVYSIIVNLLSLFEKRYPVNNKTFNWFSNCSDIHHLRVLQLVFLIVGTVIDLIFVIPLLLLV